MERIENCKRCGEFNSELNTDTYQGQNGFSVKCHECQTRVWAKTEEEAIKYWNRMRSNMLVIDKFRSKS